MSTKNKSRTKTPTKRAAKPAKKTPKPNGAADPTASLETLTALVNDLNAKLSPETRAHLLDCARRRQLTRGTFGEFTGDTS